MSTCVVTVINNRAPATPSSAGDAADGADGGGGYDKMRARSNSTTSSSSSNSSSSHSGAPRHVNQLHRRLSRCPSTTLSDLIPAATAALREQQAAAAHVSTETTPLARALTKVKLQIQSKRLKERYLGHEWIRLALDLPVDERMINNPKHAPAPRIIAKQCSPDKIPPPSAAHMSVEEAATCMVALKNLDGRTGEIVAWYEWKFDKSKFSVDDIQSKVDRLRQIKIEHTITPPESPSTLASPRRRRAPSTASVALAAIPESSFPPSPPSPAA